MIDLAKIDTTIQLGGIAIHQPVTVFTDYIITGLCVYFYIALKQTNANDKSIFYWRLFFLNLAISTFLGGCSHGFYTDRSDIGYKTFWLSMQAVSGVAMFSAQLATLNSILQHFQRKTLLTYLSATQLLAVIPAVFVFQNYNVTVVNSALSLIPIMILHFKDSKLNRSSLWIAYGILVGFLTAIVHLAKFSLHVYFNYLDIAHVLIMINLYIIFTGVKQKAISLTSL